MPTVFENCGQLKYDSYTHTHTHKKTYKQQPKRENKKALCI